MSKIEDDIIRCDREVKSGPESKLDIEDLSSNLKLLIQLNETIKSEVSELLAKSKRHDAYQNAGTLYINGFGSKNGEIPHGTNDEDHVEVETTFSDLDSDSVILQVNVSTQTSLSSSVSSTNLTWASSGSSSGSEYESSSVEDRNWTGRLPWQSAKFSSAPLLEKASPSESLEVSKQCRSQSDRHLTEIEAAEACKWLRATGFPQYAQMYEDMEFPIDITTAAQDHPFLESDALHSLFRRLQILNSCAHLHQQRGAHPEESEDEHCALSSNWTYQKDIRRWSRTCTKVPLEELTKRLENASIGSQDRDDAFEKCTQSPKERLKRAGSSKFRRRREGILFSEGDASFSDDYSPIRSLRHLGTNHVSDSESTPKHQRRARTKSFDKTDTWLQDPNSVEGVVWRKLQEGGKHSEKVDSENIPREADNALVDVEQLSAAQLQVLGKLALLKLTAHMEKYCPSHRTGWNWDLPKFIRKMKAPAYKDKNVFGVPLSVTLQRTGQVLPKTIEEALRWLQQNAADQIGIFRKPGVKSRIQALRNVVETNECIDFVDQQSYDVADMVKQYFRDLPETLLTNKLSETFILIFQYVPIYLRRESVLCAILLMPDEHTEVLKTLLHFLLLIAKHSEVNQMNESNLAMCFAPSLFYYSQAYKQSLGSPHPKELAENKAGHDCLLYFLKNFDYIFKVPLEFIKQCKPSDIKEAKAKLLNHLGAQNGGWREYLDECEANLIKEVREKQRGWIGVTSHHPKVDIHYKKVADGIPLWLWKTSAEIEAPPTEVLHRLIRERHIWDPELRSAKIIAQLEPRTEVFQYVRGSIVPRQAEEYCVVRTWRVSIPRDGCLLVETSVEHPDAIPVPQSTRGLVLASRYLVEPCGSGRSRLVHFSRIDTMGRAPDWYQKHFGHLQALFLANIQNSFSQNALGPESKV
ncbi:rho GTPase-activating protein 7 [Cylas formicarius]|uniref:rho GTPase-activating protein 7 n=1 Tax=Cylas formicarius TaxID=197179 RepID=UPI0029585547|nr:rho GTPase-activating protein 7 [Cylas formicarius]